MNEEWPENVQKCIAIHDRALHGYNDSRRMLREAEEHEADAWIMMQSAERMLYRAKLAHIRSLETEEK